MMTMKITKQTTGGWTKATQRVVYCVSDERAILAYFDDESDARAFTAANASERG
jgi:hypothetical protein